MKKIILILICTGFSYNLYAQQQKVILNLAYYNHLFDSLVSTYSTEQWKDPYDARFHFYEANLNNKEKKKLIDRIHGMFEQNEYANLYRLGHRMIYHMWWVAPGMNSLEVKQKLMELHLQYYFYPGVQQITDDYELDSKPYTKKAKKRIVEILEDKKTQKEYEIWLKREKSSPSFYNSKSWEDAARIMKKQEIQNAEVLKQIRDSLLTDFIYQCAKENFESLQIKPELIKIIGLLEMKECIPVLKQNLAYCIDSSCVFGQEKAYRYALARLGDKEQRQYILDNLMDIEYLSDGYFDRRNFAYFRDDEMIWRYIDVNYTFDKSIHFDSEGTIPTALMTISNAYPFIKNLPEELNPPYMSNNRNDHYQWAKSLYEWLMANKESIQFDYEGDKEEKWFW